MTPGMQTSEFYVTCLVVVSTVVLAIFGVIEGGEGLAAITGAGAAYNISRGLSKRNDG